MYSFLPSASNPLDRIKKAFSILPKQINQFYIAFSGGLDSCVLLHTIHILFPKHCIKAIHINHGLQSEALQWEKHCQTICDNLEIPLLTYSIASKIEHYKKTGHSPEDAARKARYQALFHAINEKGCLLTGHHLEDQAETVLLHLMRGSGIRGLQGMQLLSRPKNFYHLRPLLHWGYAERLQYAKENKLQWIEDPSNQDQKLTRNFIRHTAIPTLQQHFPKPIQMLERASIHCTEANHLSIEIAREDLLSCQIQPQLLSIHSLLALSVLRRRNALRYWLHHHLGQHPYRIQFEQIEKLLYTAPNRGSTFDFQSISIKRYRGHLHFIKKEKPQKAHPMVIPWHVYQPITLPSGDTLTATHAYARGIRVTVLKENPLVEIRFRQGGERFQPKGRLGSHPLKKLFQEWAIPPWKRYQWPLIYYNNQLVAVADLGVSEKFSARSNEEGLWISRTPSTKISF